MKKYLLITMGLLALLFLGACSTKYVCYEGTVVDNERDCPILPVIRVTDREAGAAADRFGQAHAQAKGDQYSRVNIYREEGDWFTNVLFIERQTERVHEATLKVDGRTTTVTCVSGCEYMQPRN